MWQRSNDSGRGGRGRFSERALDLRSAPNAPTSQTPPSIQPEAEADRPVPGRGDGAGGFGADSHPGDDVPQ